MRKNYRQPATEIAEVMTTMQLLTGSPASPAGAPLNVGRIGYGTAESDTWN